MANLLRADLFRLRHSTGVLVCLIVAVASAAGYVYLSHAMATGALDASAANSASVVSDVMIVNLLGSLLVGLLVSHDFETKAIHDALLASSRATFVAAKAVMAAGLVMALVAPYGIAALVGFVSGGEFALFLPTPFLDVVANEAGLAVDAGSIASVVAVAAVTSLRYAALLSICVPLAFALRKPVAVMAIGFAWGFVADFLVSLTDDSAVIGPLVALTPYAPRHIPALASGGADLVATAGVSVVFIAVMAAVTQLFFRRSDIP